MRVVLHFHIRGSRYRTLPSAVSHTVTLPVTQNRASRVPSAENCNTPRAVAGSSSDDLEKRR